MLAVLNGIKPKNNIKIYTLESLERERICHIQYVSCNIFLFYKEFTKKKKKNPPTYSFLIFIKFLAF